MRSVLVRRILVALALVGACALCFGRLTIHPADILTGPQRDGANDLTDYFLPLRTYQIESWRRYGQLPTWDSNLQLGRPTAGNPQSSLFYPPNWLYLLTGTAGIASWVMVLHHLFAGWGMYLLCRRHEFNPIAATVGAVTFLAAPYFVAQTAEGHYPQICVAAWIPWALLAYERLRQGKKYSLPIMALVLAIAFFCGHAQELYYLVIALSVLWVVDLIRQPPDALPRTDLALRWIGVGCLTAGLVACELGTVWLTAKEATRGQGKLTAAAAGGAELANLQQLICPFALGTPAEMLTQREEFYWETLLSFGVAPLALAVAAILLSAKTHLTVRYSTLLLVAIVFALGDTTPVYTILHNYFPGMSTFREPSRVMFLASAAVAVLASAGTHRLMSLPKRESALSKLMPTLGVLLGALVVAELSVYGWVVTRTIPPEGYRHHNELAEQFAGSVLEYRVLMDQQLLSDGEAISSDIAKVRGYDPFYLVRHQAMLQAMFGNRQYLVAEVPGYATDEQLNYADGPLQVMGVRYAAVSGHKQLERPQWRLVKQGELPPRIRLRGTPADRDSTLPYSLYEFQSPMPRAFVLGHTKIAATGPAVIGQFSQLDPRKQVLVPEDPLPAGTRQDFKPATIVDFSPAHVVVEAELDAPGLLVFAETYSKGWQASVDGQQANLTPVYLGFRGVELPPGKHQVEFTFEPPLRKVGLVVTAIGLVVVGLLFWNDFRPLEAETESDDKLPESTAS